MSISFSNICSLNKLPIRPLFLFKSSSRKTPIICSPKTRNAGLVLECNYSEIPTNKLGHHVARNPGNDTTLGNEFSGDTEQFLNNKKRKLANPEPESHAPDPQLRNGVDDTDSYSNNSTLSHVDSFLILRRHEYPKVQGAFDSVKATLLPILLQKLKHVRPGNVTVESGLETAASIDLLRLFGASSRKLDEIGRRALQGARLLEEGHNKVNNGERMLKRAFHEIPNHLE